VDLRTDHVKLESPSILTKNSFSPGHWGGGAGPPLSTPVCSTSSFCTVAWQLARSHRHDASCGPSAKAELLVVSKLFTFVHSDVRLSRIAMRNIRCGLLLPL